jgi:hypothetical protein
VIGGESKETGLFTLFTACFLNEEANLKFKGVAHAKYLGVTKVCVLPCLNTHVHKVGA